MANPQDTIKLVVDMGPSATNVKEVSKAVEDLGASAKKAEKPLDDLAGEKKPGGRGMMGVSYAFQDFMSVLSGGGGIARALGSVTNNFDQMATAMGASVATAAKLSLGFTGFVSALPILIPMVQEFWKSMQGGGQGPEPILKAIDIAQQKIELMRTELEKILAMRPPQEVETKQLFEKALGGRGPEITGGLARALALSGGGATAREVATEQERRVAARAAADIERLVAVSQVPQEGVAREHPEVVRERLEREAREMREEIGKRINEANVTAAGKIMAGAATQRADRDALRRLVRQFPTAFPSEPGRFDLGAELAVIEPEVVKRHRRQSEQTQRTLEANAARVRQEKAAAKEAEDLTNQGRENQADSERDRDAQLKRDRDRRERGLHAEAEAQRDSMKKQRELTEGLHAAAVIRAQEGVQLDPKDALRVQEQRAREQQREQLDRAQQLRTAEAIYQQSGGRINYDATAPLEALRRHNAELMDSMNDFVRANVEAASGQRAMVQDLRNGAQMIRGETRQNQQPAWSGGKP